MVDGLVVVLGGFGRTLFLADLTVDRPGCTIGIYVYVVVVGPYPIWLNIHPSSFSTQKHSSVIYIYLSFFIFFKPC